MGLLPLPPQPQALDLKDEVPQAQEQRFLFRGHLGLIYFDAKKQQT